MEKTISLLELFPCLNFFRDSEKTETVWWMFGVKQNSFESIRRDMVQSQTRRTINFLFQNGGMIIMCRNRFLHAETWKSVSHRFGGKLKRNRLQTHKKLFPLWRPQPIIKELLNYHSSQCSPGSCKHFLVAAKYTSFKMAIKLTVVLVLSSLSNLPAMGKN